MTEPRAPDPTATTEHQRRGLQADCARCFGLCCVALAFTPSADFALDKELGDPCPNLQHDHRCAIHPRLRQQGFAGCTVYDCIGSGQKVSQHTFGGRDWRTSPEVAPAMFAVFPRMRQLHEMLWFLAEALALPAARSLHDELHRSLEQTDQLTLGSPEAILALDLEAHRRGVNALLVRASELARAAFPPRKKSLRGADLIGAKLRDADLRGADLRGSYLLGADLRGADLTAADLIGADLRGADLRGANLADSLFVTQFQINAARGDEATRLPPSLTRPAYWPASQATALTRLRQKPAR